MALPVSLDLRGRTVVAIGGGPVSARRVRSFLEEGAAVTVIAPRLCADLRDHLVDGRLRWLDRPYAGPADVTAAALVHTATGDRVVDRAVSADCEAQGVWCINASDAASGSAASLARTTVDLPDGPVGVTVSAAGDPRRARRLREAVRTALLAGPLPLQRQRSRTSRGWVALVGGGPGEDGLLTLRAHQLIRAADVLVVDRLGPRGVLADLPSSVRVIDVGKEPGHHAVPQDRINQILVEEALAGHAVVRLKGGDPYVLGRGGEERLACEAHGIPVEVVPGVTSAISVPAAAGIPVTHRGLARGFTVVSGHEDIPHLPTGEDHTLILLMGIGGLARTVDLLITHGRDGHCPVAIIERGWLPDQRVTIAPLAKIATLAAEEGVRSPAVIVVGAVVRLSPHHQDQQPLNRFDPTPTTLMTDRTDPLEKAS